MFSRAAKSVVKNLGQRKYYVNEEKIKVRVIGAAGEIGQTLSKYTKTGSKFQSPSIPNSRSKSRVLVQTLEKSRSLKTSQALKVRDPKTECFPQKCQRKTNAIPCYFANRELDLERTVTGLKDKEMKLSSENSLKKQPETSGQRSISDFPVSEARVIGQMWAVTRLPAVQHGSLRSQWRQLAQTRSEGLTSYMPRSVQACEGAILICGDCGSEEPPKRQENPCKKKKKNEENPCKPKCEKPSNKPKKGNICQEPKEENTCNKSNKENICEEENNEPCKGGQDFSRKSKKSNGCPPVVKGCK